MKKIFLIFFISFLLSCETYIEDIIACPSVARPSLLINLTNGEGENLLQNGTFIAEDIRVRTQDIEYAGVPSDIDGIYKNFVTVEINGSEGINEFLIELSDSDTDTLRLDLAITIFNDECDIRLPVIKETSYNGEIKQLILFSDNLNEVIQVVK